MFKQRHRAGVVIAMTALIVAGCGLTNPSAKSRRSPKRQQRTIDS